MKIAIIGAGRVATNLAPALQTSRAEGVEGVEDIEVVEVWSRTRASAEALAARVGCRASWGSYEAVTREADLYLLALKDDALSEAVCQLHSGREQALMAHTAGSMPLSLFVDAGHERGAVFYPMQTFSKERRVDFSTVHFFLEAAQEADAQLLKRLALALTGNAQLVHRSTSALRRQLHLAAVFACNFSNHCFAISDELLRECNLDFSVMLPLVEETVAKLHDLSPREAQTGPAVRRDEQVMGLQRAMLVNRPDLQRLYTLLSEDIMKS